MITRGSYIEDIVEKYPQVVRPLKEHGIACIVCGEPVWGTLEEYANSKHIENLDAIIDQMNTLINESEA